MLHKKCAQYENSLAYNLHIQPYNVRVILGLILLSNVQHFRDPMKISLFALLDDELGKCDPNSFCTA